MEFMRNFAGNKNNNNNWQQKLYKGQHNSEELINHFHPT